MIDEVGWRQAWLVAAGTIALVVVPVSWFGIIDRPSAVVSSPTENHPPTTPTTLRSGCRTQRSGPHEGVLDPGARDGARLDARHRLNFHQIALLGESGFTETEAAIMFLPQVLGSSVGSPAWALRLTGWVLDTHRPSRW